jgi:uncharacterized repeat protein (TIGR04076 family)
MSAFKITVLKTIAYPDLVETYGVPGIPLPCPVFSEGQEFIAQYDQQPEEFCGSAWSTLRERMMILRNGGNFAGWSNDEQSIVVCCSDGFRPVVFELKKIDDPSFERPEE